MKNIRVLIANDNPQIITDIDRPTMPCLDVVHQLDGLMPHIKVIVLTDHEESDQCRTGVCGKGSCIGFPHEDRGSGPLQQGQEIIRSRLLTPPPIGSWEGLLSRGVIDTLIEK